MIFVVVCLLVAPVESYHAPLKTFAIEGRCAAPRTEAAAFESIYNTGFWGKPLANTPKFYYTYGYPERLTRSSSSGQGSDIGPATQASLAFLSGIIQEFNISSLLDVPCGDTNWQFEAWEVDSLPVYVGLDIARSVIELNTRKFSFHVNKRFAVWDFAECALPRYRHVRTQATLAFELVHVRDVLQHMPLSRAVAAIENVRKSGARWLVATTYPNGRNYNIRDGEWYPANLAAAPFQLPRPENCVQTHPAHEADITCLYKL